MTPKQPTLDTELPDDIRFVLKLSRGLHQHGVAAHRLEAQLRQVAGVLRLEGSFFATPTAVFSSFETRGADQTFLQRMEGADVDLGKLSELDGLADDVMACHLSPQEGAQRVDQIVARAPEYGKILTLLCFALTSSAASRLFGGGAVEVALSAVAGGIIGLLALSANRWAAIGRLFEPIGGIAISFFAAVCASWLAPASAPVITLAGLIVLLPGLTLTVAFSELAARSLVSGTSRLSGALIVFLMLGFGVVVGGRLAGLMVGPAVDVVPIPLPQWTEWPAVVIAALTLTVLFRAPRRDLGWIVLAGLATYLGVSWGSRWVGAELGVFFGALVIGVFSNLHARRLRRPSMVTRVPGMMLLVPGALGFLSVSSLLDHDPLAGVQSAFTVAFMAVAMVTGLLIANSVVPPRRFR